MAPGSPAQGRARSGRSGSGGRGPAAGAGGFPSEAPPPASPSPSLRLCVRRSLPTGTRWAQGQGHAGDLAPGDSPGHLRGPVSSPIPRSKVRRPRGHSVGTKVSPDRPQWGSGALLAEESGEPPSAGKGSRAAGRPRRWALRRTDLSLSRRGPALRPWKQTNIRRAWRPRHATCPRAAPGRWPSRSNAAAPGEPCLPRPLWGSVPVPAGALLSSSPPGPPGRGGARR
uniref:Uncharacterized protein n=1 Tax=Myotis myotis TaxID=51298 RepID=A0A7J7RLQ5_MYOMY|nr:hypothetical protein mMyoMyo1_010273 [Myotis myotis]